MEKYEIKEDVAIITDIHGLYEPAEAVLDDIHKRGITRIYSLGDNIGVGPNPREVMDLLEEYNVISLAGNSEDYVTLGIEPFASYFNEAKRQSQAWTLSQLRGHHIGKISLFPHSIELLSGGKKIVLCHFANDVRFDYLKNNTSTYQDRVSRGLNGYEQFRTTNSRTQKFDMNTQLILTGKNDPKMRGIISAKKEPLFNGESVFSFDAVIQGHIHWDIYEKSPTTEFYSIRAVGMGYDSDLIDTASYVILHPKENDFTLEKVLVKYDRERMEASILSSDSPDETIYRFTNMKKRM